MNVHYVLVDHLSVLVIFIMWFSIYPIKIALKVKVMLGLLGSRPITWVQWSSRCDTAWFHPLLEVFEFLYKNTHNLGLRCKSLLDCEFRVVAKKMLWRFFFLFIFAAFAFCGMFNFQAYNPIGFLIMLLRFRSARFFWSRASGFY